MIALTRARGSGCDNSGISLRPCLNLDSGRPRTRSHFASLASFRSPKYTRVESAIGSVLMPGLVVGLLLVARGFLLVLGLPLVVRHPVNDLAGLRIGHLDALLARLLAVPARQAVAAEAGEIHQVDVLHVGALLQVRDQAAEGGSLEFGLGLVVHGFLLRPKIWAQSRAAATAVPI